KSRGNPCCGVDLQGFLRIFRAPSAGPAGPPCSFMPSGILGQNPAIPLGMVGLLGPGGLQSGAVMIAVIRTGGKQYTVAAEETHEIERIPGEAGSQVEFTDVLMV